MLWEQIVSQSVDLNDLCIRFSFFDKQNRAKTSRMGDGCGSALSLCHLRTMTITLEQVAKLAGVSRSTASRVLNGHPHVSPETRARVHEVMQAYGFEPNPTARALANRRHPEQALEDAMET